MTQVFVASTFAGAMTVAAALNGGAFGPPNKRRRVLVVANTSMIPEITPPLDQLSGFSALSPYFDETVSWNAVIDPVHPERWTPRTEDAPVLERLLRSRWSLGSGPIDLAAESIHANPAQTLLSIFADAPIDVYSGGLTSYGPTHRLVPDTILGRVRRLLYLNLIPQLQPLLFSELRQPTEVIPDAAFRHVMFDVAMRAIGAAPRPRSAGEKIAVVLGQHLADLEVVSSDEEHDLHLRMIEAAVVSGVDTVVFKPHPATPQRPLLGLKEAVGAQGTRLEVVEPGLPAESLYEHLRPDLVVGCCSTSLVLANKYFNLPVACVGSQTVLERLTPYENCDRIPATIIDAIIPPIETVGGIPGQGDPYLSAPRLGEQLSPLVAAVAYCMNASGYPQLRDAAVRYLKDGLSERTARYFRRRRLSSLDLL